MIFRQLNVRRGPGRRCITGVGFIALSQFALAGCSLPEDGIFARHMEKNPRGKAQERWDGMRGNMTLQLAQQHFKAGRLKEADEAFRKVTGSAPLTIEICKFGALLYLEMGRLSSAQELIAKAADLPGYDADAVYLSAMIEERYGHTKKALAHYKVALEMKPDDPDYVLATAELYVASGSPDKAIELLNARSRDFDGCGAIALLAAKICRMTGRKDSAVAYCRRALHEQNCDADTLSEIGQLLVWAGRYAEAVGVLKPLVVMSQGAQPDENGLKFDASAKSSTRLALAEALVGVGRNDEARAILTGIMSDDPHDRAAWGLFARAAIAQGDLKSAGAAIEQFHRRNLPTADTLLMEAFIAYRNGEYSLATDICDRALAAFPDCDTAKLLRDQIGRRVDAGRVQDRVTPAEPKAVAQSGRCIGFIAAATSGAAGPERPRDAGTGESIGRLSYRPIPKKVATPLVGLAPTRILTNHPMSVDDAEPAMEPADADSCNFAGGDASRLRSQARVACLAGFHLMAADLCDRSLRLDPASDAARQLHEQIRRRALWDGVLISELPARIMSDVSPRWASAEASEFEDHLSRSSLDTGRAIAAGEEALGP